MKGTEETSIKNVTSGELIADWETDLIFTAFPQFMSYYRKLRPFFDELLHYFVKYDKVVCFTDCNSNYKAIDGIIYAQQPNIDIWIRDYAPLVSSNMLYQYTYLPTYFPKSQSIKINQSFENTTNKWPVKKLDLVTDGGNFIHNGEIVIMTEKIYQLNPDLSKEAIDNIFYDMGAKKIVILPKHPYDVTGHADGMVKFIDKNRLFVTIFKDDQKFSDVVCKILKESLPNIKIYELPFYFNGASFEHWEDASGIYINFLQTKNAVYVPIFGIEQDMEVINLMKKVFNKPIEFIRTESLAKFGGLINCATWNVPSFLMNPWIKSVTNTTAI